LLGSCDLGFEKRERQSFLLLFLTGQKTKTTDRFIVLINVFYFPALFTLTVFHTPTALEASLAFTPVIETHHEAIYVNGVYNGLKKALVTGSNVKFQLVQDPINELVCFTQTGTEVIDDINLSPLFRGIAPPCFYKRLEEPLFKVVIIRIESVAHLDYGLWILLGSYDLVLKKGGVKSF